MSVFCQPINLERISAPCLGRANNVSSKSGEWLNANPFEKFDFFNIPYPDKEKLLAKAAIFHLETMCVLEEEDITGTETTTWIEKHIPTAVSISKNLRPHPVVLRSSNPRELISSFVDALENLATEVKTQMRAHFFEAEISINSKLSCVMESLNELQSNQEATLDFEDECCRDDSKEGIPQSTQFLQMQKKQLIELKEPLERHCNLLSVFEVKNYNHGVYFVNMYLLPILVKKCSIKSTVIKNVKPCVSIKFDDIDLFTLSKG